MFAILSCTRPRVRCHFMKFNTWFLPLSFVHPPHRRRYRTHRPDAEGNYQRREAFLRNLEYFSETPTRRIRTTLASGRGVCQPAQRCSAKGVRRILRYKVILDCRDGIWISVCWLQMSHSRGDGGSVGYVWCVNTIGTENVISSHSCDGYVWRARELSHRTFKWADPARPARKPKKGRRPGAVSGVVSFSQTNNGLLRTTNCFLYPPRNVNRCWGGKKVYLFFGIFRHLSPLFFSYMFRV